MAAINVDRTFSALADPTRRRLVDLLKKTPRRAGELAAAVKMTAPAMSRHLRVLRRAGLVEKNELDEDARVRVYRLRPEPFAQVRDWLEEVAALCAGQLGGVKAHAERTRKVNPK